MKAKNLIKKSREETAFDAGLDAAEAEAQAEKDDPTPATKPTGKRCSYCGRAGGNASCINHMRGRPVGAPG